jgi:hypothetical protein
LDSKLKNIDSGSNLKKMITVVVLLLVLGVAAYYLFFKKAEPVETLFDEFGNPVEAQVVGQDLIDLLAELQSVRFETSFFRTQAFLNLVDYKVDLGTQPQGRQNPFDVIGRGAGAPTR